jgi:hypothetical protein
MKTQIILLIFSLFQTNNVITTKKSFNCNSYIYLVDTSWHSRGIIYDKDFITQEFSDSIGSELLITCGLGEVCFEDSIKKVDTLFYKNRNVYKYYFYINNLNIYQLFIKEDGIQIYITYKSTFNDNYYLENLHNILESKIR